MSDFRFEVVLPPEVRGFYTRMMNQSDPQEPANVRLVLEMVEHGLRQVSGEQQKTVECLKTLSTQIQKHESWEPHLITLGKVVEDHQLWTKKIDHLVGMLSENAKLCAENSNAIHGIREGFRFVVGRLDELEKSMGDFA